MSTMKRIYGLYTPCRIPFARHFLTQDYLTVDITARRTSETPELEALRLDIRIFDKRGADEPRSTDSIVIGSLTRVQK